MVQRLKPPLASDADREHRAVAAADACSGKALLTIANSLSSLLCRCIASSRAGVRNIGSRAAATSKAVNRHAAQIYGSYATRHFYVHEGLSFLRGKLLGTALPFAVRDDPHCLS